MTASRNEKPHCAESVDWWEKVALVTISGLDVTLATEFLSLGKMLPSIFRNWIVRNRPRHMARLAALFAFVLVAHSFDPCGAHSGTLSPPAANTALSAAHHAHCAAPPGVACLCGACACVPTPSIPEDACEQTSELAIPVGSLHLQFDAPVIVLPAFAANLNAIEVLAPVAAFLNGDGPPLARLRSQFHYSPLAGRAPPVSL